MKIRKSNTESRDVLERGLTDILRYVNFKLTSNSREGFNKTFQVKNIVIIETQNFVIIKGRSKIFSYPQTYASIRLILKSSRRKLLV